MNCRSRFSIALLVLLVVWLAVACLCAASPGVASVGVRSVGEQVGAALGEALVPDALEVGNVVQDASIGAIEKARLVLAQHRSLVIALTIPFGLILMVAGFWVLNPAMFCAAFAVGGFVAYVSVYNLTKHTSAATWASISALLLGGLLLGLLSLYLVPLGVFALGATMGAVLGLALNTVVIAFRPDQAPWTAYILIGALAVVFGVLALQVQYTLLIVATAFSGSFMMLSGLGFFVGHFPRFSNMERSELMRDPLALLYFAMYIVLGVIGCVIQFRLRKRWSKQNARQRYYYVDDDDDDGGLFRTYA
eukprot:CAMPEP_0185844800 /NCGR_PEP_ID=MMETSP1354-20130828/907_1 /TAXON_ID=708628 /ORGANISM="Erythrolobus madagascarensis, Strain CCMP3276" /LENGTH=305 /DNA_ID=CAMNT_0028544575 /DNA_START=38 /DNA_END=955 /DNA_ORIENTATION=-